MYFYLLKYFVDFVRFFCILELIADPVVTAPYSETDLEGVNQKWLIRQVSNWGYRYTMRIASLISSPWTILAWLWAYTIVLTSGLPMEVARLRDARLIFNFSCIESCQALHPWAFLEHFSERLSPRHVQIVFCYQ